MGQSEGGFQRASWWLVEAGGRPPHPGRLRRRCPLVPAASASVASLGRDETSASLGDSFHGVLVDDFFHMGLGRFGPGKYHTGLNRTKENWVGRVYSPAGLIPADPRGLDPKPRGVGRNRTQPHGTKSASPGSFPQPTVAGSAFHHQLS